MAPEVDTFHFRLVLLGSHETGKTSILNRFLFKKFETKYKPTVEDLFSKAFDLGSIEIKVDFLDTSGSMQFPAMRRLSISTGNAFLIVYAIDDEQSYDVLKMCVAEIQEIRPDFQEIPIVFAGNKCDIARQDRKVSKEVVSNYVHYELPRMRAKVIECSCKDSINIDEIFRAYLSLAKVSLSSAVGLRNRYNSTNSRLITSQAGSFNKSPNDKPAAKESDRCASVKTALGVRKSCDASIISPRKQNRGSLTPTKARHHFTLAEQGPSEPEERSTLDKSEQAPSTTTEVNLKTAIEQKIASERAKPRSRSLIWRPIGKSRTTSESSECRVT